VVAQRQRAVEFLLIAVAEATVIAQVPCPAMSMVASPSQFPILRRTIA